MNFPIVAGKQRILGPRTFLSLFSRSLQAPVHSIANEVVLNSAKSR